MAVSVPPDPTAGGSLPPQNQEAEVSVLGAILINERLFDRVLIDAKLQPGDFYRDRHTLIFQAMRRLKEKASPEPIDVLTVCEQLQRSGELDAAGGSSYVHSLPTLVPATANAPHYARIVKEHSLLRRLLHASIEIRERVLAFSGDPQELVDQAEQTLFKVAHEERTGDVRSIGDVLHDEVDKLEKVSREGVELTGTPSGFRDLDSLTGGFQPGNLIVLAARPAMGKSAMVVNIAENASVDKQRPVALFSLEMSEAELAQRFLASRARLDGDDLRKGRVKSDRWPKILKAAEKYSSAPLYVDDSSDLGIHELRAKARRLQSRHDLGLVIVDYLQLMRPENGSVSRVEQIGHMSRGLKILARELDVPVIAVSQLSRAVESRPDKRPLLSDLRESGCLTGESRVYLPRTGEQVAIADVVGREGFEVLAMNTDTWRLEPRQVTRAFATGRKRVHRLTTGLGKQIRATANHRFLTVEGWRRLDELEPGNHVALPRELPGPSVRSGITTRGLQAGLGTNLSRERAGQVAELVECEQLRTPAAGDAYWDRIVSIEADGVEEVYDLTVEGLHNFVADGIVVHNSIEQDADLVCFIYRDEYYNKESERPGEADIILAKHRNGPIGDAVLTFMPRYPKFANLYRDHGTDGGAAGGNGHDPVP
ncbi:MAG: replicative DNA helicase [Thermoleophilaceae bacterium]